MNSKQLALIEGGTELDHYDPEEGLLAIDVLETAEKRFARAKDPKNLFKAIEAKITEQRKFVRWWDGQAKAQGHRSDLELRNGPVTKLIAGRNGLPSRMVIERWRKRTNDDEQFAKTIEDAQERALRICHFEKTIRGTEGTGENEWFTPGEYIKAAREVLGGIDLDPASHPQAQTIVQAEQYFSKDDNGLAQEWHGRVWLNPPYAQPLIAEFVSKMCSERKAGRVTAGIMLTHNYTDTSWFHEAAGVADAICFTRGRVKFYEPDGGVAAPTQGQAFFYFGPEVKLFAARFNATGFVMVPT